MKLGIEVIGLAGCLFFLSCSTPPVDSLMAQYDEQERVIAYKAWKQACLDAGGMLCIVNPTRPCKRRNGCIPDKIDWSHKRKHNRLVCARECL